MGSEEVKIVPPGLPGVSVEDGFRMRRNRREEDFVSPEETLKGRFDTVVEQVRTSEASRPQFSPRSEIADKHQKELARRQRIKQVIDILQYLRSNGTVKLKCQGLKD